MTDITPEELRNAAALLRRGSWVAPELFEESADTIERLQARIAELEATIGTELQRLTDIAMGRSAIMDKNAALTLRIAELEQQVANQSR
jgi:septal ring factor EnvC (AmiA/AmiB activator)